MLIKYQNHVYISPEDCGSGVGYHITTSEWKDQKTGKTEYSLSASVKLSDCNRMIDWDFRDDGEEKINSAISMLQEFRKKYLDTKKVVEELNK
jgi:hypothetical protein